MKRAIDLAKKGKGEVNPNPLVGAVIVKDGEIIGEGHHKKLGGKHAEINALDSCKEKIEGGILYVNLEPCTHYGKTSPCVDRIIEEGISEVFISMKDPNPEVYGRGIKKLRENGIKVYIGLLEEESKRLNEIFIKHMKSEYPFIVLKGGISLDGKIATKTGESMWITGEKSRNHAHGLRDKYSGILVGIETVIKDNPRLTCRIENGKNPVRIVLDSNLRIPINSKILKKQDSGKTIIATLKNSNSEKKQKLSEMGIKVIEIEEERGRINLKKLFKRLKDMDIDSILIEGGGTVNYSLLESDLIDKLYLYIAPKIIGGKDSKNFVAGEGVDELAESFNFNIENIQSLGEDILLEAYRKR